eukprot:scaffold183042_cov34-Prasinocladus_malaysianus.AAC.1
MKLSNLQAARTFEGRIVNGRGGSRRPQPMTMPADSARAPGAACPAPPAPPKSSSSKMSRHAPRKAKTSSLRPASASQGGQTRLVWTTSHK